MWKINFKHTYNLSNLSLKMMWEILFLFFFRYNSHLLKYLELVHILKIFVFLKNWMASSFFIFLFDFQWS